MKVETLNHKDAPRVVVSAETLLKFYHILDSNYTKEFTVFTHAYKHDDTREYEITDFFIPKQVNTGVHTELDGEDLISMLEDGADISELRGHIHSHVNMAVFPSSTDKEEILARAELAEFNVALIINKKKEMYAHVVDQELGFYMTAMDVYIRYPYGDGEFETQMLSDIKLLESVDQVRELVKMSEWDYFAKNYSLTAEEEADIKEKVESRFVDEVIPQANLVVNSPVLKKSTGTSHTQDLGNNKKPQVGKIVNPSWDEFQNGTFGAAWENAEDYYQQNFGTMTPSSIDEAKLQVQEEVRTMKRYELYEKEDIEVMVSTGMNDSEYHSYLSNQAYHKLSDQEVAFMETYVENLPEYDDLDSAYRQADFDGKDDDSTITVAGFRF